MIPKRMIFIWLGSKLPEYGKFCIESFKKVNPSFEVMLVNQLDLGNVQNEDLKECIKLVNSDNYNIYKHMTCRPYAKEHLVGSNEKYATTLSDAFRLYLLNKYGGIYLDLDTFPVKSFDDKLLEYNGFAINHAGNRCDYFFLGFNKHCVDDKLIRYIVPYKKGQIFDYSIVHKIIYNDNTIKIFSNRRQHLVQKFLACRLDFGEHIIDKRCVAEYYIDHFRLGSWIKDEDIDR